MTTVDSIYTRHERALMAVGHASAVVRLSLRLALDELAAAIPATAKAPAIVPDLLAILKRHNIDSYEDVVCGVMTAAAAIGELMDTAATQKTLHLTELAELRQRLAEMDADNAALIQRLHAYEPIEVSE